MMDGLKREIRAIFTSGRMPRLIVLTHDQVDALLADARSLMTVLTNTPVKASKFMGVPIVEVDWWDRNANVLDETEAATFFDQRGKYDRPRPQSLT